MMKFTKISLVIIYTNYSTTISIFKQITFITFNTNKFNLRLVKASQYLFDFNIFVRHKIDKINIVFDALFRLQTNVFIIDKLSVLKSLYDHFIDLLNVDFITYISNLSIYHIILIEINDEFKQKFKQIFLIDKYWFVILIIIRSKTSKTKKLTSLENTTRDIKFNHRDKLLYFIIKNKQKRFCIFEIIKKKIFKQIYDVTYYNEFMHIYDRLCYFIYCCWLIKYLKIYIIYCSNYQRNQTKRYSIYENLNSIVTFAISFHIIIMNFIMTLLFNRDKNILLIIICKFIKRIFFLITIFENSSNERIKFWLIY